MDGRIQSELIWQQGTEERLKTLPSYVTEWYVNLRASKKTGSTCRDYVLKVERFLSFINPNPQKVTVREITSDLVARYFLSTQTRTVNGEVRYTSDSYQQTIWCCLNSFFEFLYKHNYIERNYIQDIDKPKNRDLDRINEHRIRLSQKDFKAILKAVDSESKEFNRIRDKAILFVFMSTGMRKTALSHIMMDDLNIPNKTLFVIDKGNKRHQYDLSNEVCSVLEDWLNERRGLTNIKDDYLFVSNRGGCLGSSTLQDIVGKYTERALGKHLSPHKLRSGYCSILYEKSGDIEFVRRAVGHANSATTQRYIVTKGDERKRAAEIMSSVLH